MSNKALVLSSGGVDSTTCLALAIERFGSNNVVSVSCTYGQKHSKEIDCARDLAKFYNINHYELNLSEIFKFSNCALLNHSTDEIKEESYEDQINSDSKGIVNTYVPFRNGLFLSSIAALALSLFPEDECFIYLGVHSGDSGEANYADCSPEFTDHMKEAISIGTYNKVHVEAPIVNLTKSEVVKEGLRLKVPYELTWSCYEGNAKACGKCGTCIERINAFRSNGVEDPIEYEGD